MKEYKTVKIPVNSQGSIDTTEAGQVLSCYTNKGWNLHSTIIGAFIFERDKQSS